jgi:ATP-dependent Lhr-like helicase
MRQIQSGSTFSSLSRQTQGSVSTSRHPSPNMTGSFELLNPIIRKFISNELGWNRLTEIQEATIPHVLDGKNVVVLAPTAGGKTESVFFPILSQIDSEKLSGVSVLYISPIKALLNNQEIRLKKLAKAVYRDAFKWHGDISKTRKMKFYQEPCSILMITPESLEVILLSGSYDKDHLFSQLRFVVIDEIHSFAEGDRGYHLISVLERLQTFSKFDIQRLGLSATVGNPQLIGTWLKGSSKRKGIVVDPAAGRKTDKKLNIFFYRHEDDFIRNIYQQFAAKKTLFFVNGRRDAERIHAILKEIMPNTYVHHSSMDKQFRLRAEEAFRLKSEPSCIICTSTMELGIDIGDLDSVIQLEAPTGVSSFLQRIGRSGRRPGTTSEMTFYISENNKLLMALAVRELSRRGFVESIVVSRRAYHIYFHQILSLIIQEFGKYRDEIFHHLSTVYCFSGISGDKFDYLLNHLAGLKILEINHKGKATLGLAGEQKFEYQNFKSLYSVFETADEYTIKHQSREIGTLQAWFVLSMGNNLSFYLAGQSWTVTDIDEENKIIQVEQSDQGNLPRWSGQPLLLTYELCQEYLKILAGETAINDLDLHEQQLLEKIQAGEAGWMKSEEIRIEQTERNISIYTFAGNKVNYTLALILRYFLKFEKFEVSGFHIVLPVHLKVEEIAAALEKLRINPNFYFSGAFTALISGYFPEVRYSKFQDFIPRELSNEYLSDLLLDTEKTRYVVQNFYLNIV